MSNTADYARQAGGRALQAGDPVEALIHLRKAEAEHPRDTNLKLEIAAAQRMSGDLKGSIATVDQALAIDPYILQAHLVKAIAYERLGKDKLAGESYRIALQLAPDPAKIPPQLRQPLAKAQHFAARQHAEYQAFLDDRLADILKSLGDEEARRLERAKGLLLGDRQIYHRKPQLLDFPELPEIQFYPRELFPWLAEVEAAAGDIREEMLRARDVMSGKFKPYVQAPAHAPVAQWAKLNHSLDWSTLHLWRDGEADEEALAACPRTVETLRKTDLLDEPVIGPTVVFSALKPHTHIPPHTGSTNIRLLCHLPLVLPGNCRFRVGDETREWKDGQAWVFDDTIEHEAWNDSDELRVILIFDVWNPFLRRDERRGVTALLAARKEWVGQDGGLQQLGA